MAHQALEGLDELQVDLVEVADDAGDVGHLVRAQQARVEVVHVVLGAHDLGGETYMISAKVTQCRKEVMPSGKKIEAKYAEIELNWLRLAIFEVFEGDKKKPAEIWPDSPDLCIFLGLHIFRLMVYK